MTRHRNRKPAMRYRVMRLDRVCGDDGSPLPLPLAGEGWGGGGSAKRAGRVDRLPPPAALWRAIALPSAIAEARLRRSYLRTAADGGLCSPASGRGEANPLAGRFNQRPSRSGLGNVPGNIGVAQAQGGLARLNGVW